MTAANYMTSVLGRKTAALEWNRHGDFVAMEELCMGRNCGTDCFKMMGVDYYPCVVLERLIACKDDGYQEVIVDFGTVQEISLKEFLRCDKRWILGALSEWQLSAFMEFVGTVGKTYKSCDYLAAFGSEEARRELNKKFNFTVRRIPISVDAFTLDRQIISFLEMLL